jgi:hypothetical protein
MRDVERIRIRKAYTQAVHRVAFWGGIRALQSDIDICLLSPLINEDLPGQAAASIYFR